FSWILLALTRYSHRWIVYLHGRGESARAGALRRRHRELSYSPLAGRRVARVLSAVAGNSLRPRFDCPPLVFRRARPCAGAHARLHRRQYFSEGTRARYLLW